MRREGRRTGKEKVPGMMASLRYTEKQDDNFNSKHSYPCQLAVLRPVVIQIYPRKRGTLDTGDEHRWPNGNTSKISFIGPRDRRAHQLAGFDCLSNEPCSQYIYVKVAATPMHFTALHLATDKHFVQD